MVISAYVPEIADRFLSLFPHRFDYLFAKHPAPGEPVQWKTESRHPLSDRMILRGDLLYGVRFGFKTRYAVIDIDRGSPYHPLRDRFAIGKIMAAIEPLGITDYVAVTSSYSAGLHLYLPLAADAVTWQLAAALEHLLMLRGFLVQAGLLEVFPNVRNYDADGPSLFNGHRLPLGPGSYLLGPDWQLTHTTPEQFCKAWEFCQRRNSIDLAEVDRTARLATRRIHRLSFKAEKFLNDLNACIEPGWTGYGQTNYLLGRITLRSYCFGHILRGGKPLTGERLIAEIVAVAMQAPGYRDWCRHQHEIWERAAEWARCVENSRYFPYRYPEHKQGKDSENDLVIDDQVLSWNAWQMERARERLCFAIADLLNRGELPATTAARFERLTLDYGFSGETLYRHRDLWHPDHLWKTPPNPPKTGDIPGGDRAGGASPPGTHTSLLAQTDRKTLPDKGFTPFWQGWDLGTGCNALPDKGSDDFSGEFHGKTNTKPRPERPAL
ncbi:hypothetical protein HNI00_07330 [Thermoleptolyngbya oregonensis NK1-22]|uniref:Uncharacterized protein n=1 Tax=Thermoleptolyngbya oregonensis NK1-22 TaxID=2547457 RepID=A0AA97BPH0_9CYAN|nr:hypothetical protein [Thermoleptolyngbya oregonensis]WOB42988.1 hypothetical protein HNI00_07330 [Thermoleptolyngbya oregonensis NK1-22]